MPWSAFVHFSDAALFSCNERVTKVLVMIADSRIRIPTLSPFIYTVFLPFGKNGPVAYCDLHDGMNTWNTMEGVDSFSLREFLNLVWEE